jgi:phage pi2 protein 07
MQQKSKTIDCNQLIKELALFSIQEGISANTFQSAYVQIINSFEIAPTNPFADLINITLSFNNANDLFHRHSRSDCSDIESFLFMANAYSQRAGALGLMLHGGIVEEPANHYSDIAFKYAQYVTFQNKEFQELSFLAALELIKTLDNRINLDGFQKYIVCATYNKEKIDFPYETYDFIEFETLLNFFDSASNETIITPTMLSRFIRENAQPDIKLRKVLFGENWEQVQLNQKSKGFF